MRDEGASGRLPARLVPRGTSCEPWIVELATGTLQEDTMGAPAKILVVDDDDDVREVLAVLLDAEGFRTETAKDGLDALEHLKAGPAPAVILLDLMMPRLDGEAFVQALGADDALASIPVVIMSGHAEASDKAAELSAAACLTKPVEIDQLLRVLARYTSPAS